MSPKQTAVTRPSGDGFAVGPEMAIHPTPLLVSVREARRMLGGMGHNQFWHHATAGEFEVTGTKRKRLVFVRSLEAFINRLPRAEYSRQKTSDVLPAA